MGHVGEDVVGVVPYDRKIIYSTYIIPEILFTDITEEGNERTYGTIYNVASGGVGKALGAKSRLGEVQTEEDQDTDSWSSRQVGPVWQSVPDTVAWQDYLFWINSATVDGSIDGPLIIRESPPVDIIFLYVGNIGSNDLKLSFDGGSSFPIKLPAGESFASRIASITSELICVDNDGAGTSNIEYLIAK